MRKLVHYLIVSFLFAFSFAAQAQPPTTGWVTLDDFSDGSFNGGTGNSSAVWNLMPDNEGPWTVSSQVLRTNMSSVQRCLISTQFNKYTNGWQFDLVPDGGFDQSIMYYFLMTNASSNPRFASGYRVRFQLNPTGGNIYYLERVTNGVPTIIGQFNAGTFGSTTRATITVLRNNGFWQVYRDVTKIIERPDDTTYPPSSAAYQGVYMFQPISNNVIYRHGFANIRYLEIPFGPFASAVYLGTCQVPSGSFFNTTGEGKDLIDPTNKVFTDTFFGTYIQNSKALVLKGAELKTFRGPNANVCIPKIYYRVFPQGSTPGSFSGFPLNDIIDNCNTENVFSTGGTCLPRDQKWQKNDTSIDLTSLNPGTYTIQLYYEISGSTSGTSGCGDTILLNNSGAYYNASFTIQSTPSLASTNPTTCSGTNGSITIKGSAPNTKYAVTYKKGSVNVGPDSLTSNASGDIVITGLNAGSYSSFSISNGCKIDIPGILSLADPVFSFTKDSTSNTVCNGTPGGGTPGGVCESKGTGVVINEVSPWPTTAQGLIGTGTEYVELYNPTCKQIDISCYVISTRAQFTGGSIIIPQGTVLQPKSHFVIGTSSSSPNSSSIDFKTNLNTDFYCSQGQFVLANTDGWIGLFDKTGTPLDAIYWTFEANNPNKITTDNDFTGVPCKPVSATDCSTSNVTLLSAAQIFANSPSVIKYVGQTLGTPTNNPGTPTGKTFSRIPDGDEWQRDINPSIDGSNCNGVCDTITPGTPSTPGTCNGSVSVTVSGSGSFKYEWKDSSNAPIGKDSAGVGNLCKGLYKVIVTNTTTGCVDSTTVRVIDEIPQVNSEFTQVAPICSGGSFTLPTTSTNNIKGSWLPAIDNTKTTTYTFTPDAGQCANSTTMTVTVNDLPTATINTPSVICSGATASFTINGTPNTVVTYNLNGGTNTIVTLDGSGSGTVTVQNATTNQVLNLVSVNNPTTTCTQALAATATVNVNSVDKPVITSSCGTGTGNVGSITVTSPTGQNIEYSLNGGAYQPSPEFTGLSNTTYKVVARANGCESSPSDELTLNCGCATPPTITMQNNQGAVCGAAPVTIIGSIGGSATLVTGSVGPNGLGTLGTVTLTEKAFSVVYTPAAADTGKTIQLTFTTNDPDGPGSCVSAEATYSLVVTSTKRPTISCGKQTTNSVEFKWDAVAGATNYNLSYEILNSGNQPITITNNDSTTLTIPSLATGAEVKITVTPVGNTGSCFEPASFTCKALACTTPNVTTTPNTVCKGTGGSGCVPEGKGLVLNEVMVFPTGGDGTPPNGLIYRGSKEYIEIFNGSCDTIDVSGYFIAMKQTLSVVSTGGTFRIPSVSAAKIPPKKHIVLGSAEPGVDIPVSDIDIFIRLATSCLYSGNFVLANIDGWCALYNAEGAPLDAIYWSSNENNINTKPNDFGGVLCLPTGSTPSSLPNAQDIKRDFPDLINYVGNNFTASAPPVSRKSDGGEWVRDLPGSISKTASTGNCNGGTCSTPSTPVQPTCNGTATVSIGNVSDYEFEWKDSLGNVVGGNTQTIDKLCAGKYTVKVTDKLTGCVGDTTVILTDNIQQVTPEFNTNVFDTICQGAILKTVTLPGLANNGITGTWNPGSLSSDVAGDISYTFTPDEGQCADPVTFTQRVNARVTPTFDFNLTSTICSGDPTTPNNLPGISNNNIIGTWSPTPISSNQSDVYTFTPLANACANTATLTVTVIQRPNVTVRQDTTIYHNAVYPGDIFSGLPTGSVVTWSNSNPGIGLPDSGTGNIPAFTAINIGTDSVRAIITVKSTNGNCAGPDKTFKITVKPLNRDVFIPNVFTPNGDGKNDLLMAYGNYITKIEMRIFNQWGQLIKVINSPNASWDGTHNGKPQPVGVYVYTLRANLADGTEINKKGSITLLR